MNLKQLIGKHKVKKVLKKINIYFPLGTKLIANSGMKLLKIEKQSNGLNTLFLDDNLYLYEISNLRLTIKHPVIRLGCLFGVTGYKFVNISVTDKVGKTVDCKNLL